MAEEFTARISVELDQTTLKAAQDKLSNIGQKEPVKIKTDIAGLKDLKEYQTRIINIQKELLKLGSSGKVNTQEYQTLSRQLQQAERNAAALEKQLISTLSDKDARTYAGTLAKNADTLELLSAKAADASREFERLKTKATIDADFKSLVQYTQEIGKTSVALAKIDKDAKPERYAYLTEKLQAAQQNAEELKSVLEIVWSPEQAQQYEALVRSNADALKSTKADVADAAREYERLNQIMADKKAAKEAQEAAKAAAKEAEEAAKAAQKEEQSRFKALIASLKEERQLQSKLAKVNPLTKPNEYNVLAGQLQAAKEKSDTLRESLKGVMTEAQKAAVEAEMKKTADALDLINAKTNDAGTSLSRFGAEFKNAFSSAALNMISGAMVFQTLERGLREAYKNVVEIDSAMTELKKVTNETDTAYSQFLANSGKAAVELGSTVTDYINSTADFARLGYDFVDAQELARVANIYSVVGDEIESIDEASQSVISTMAAFGIEADGAMSIIDKFNEVGKLLPSHIVICERVSGYIG